uniref:Retroviral polymerase SH3-like domain-containing protein n=1 Tax=Tanacetum cinerariifolium TaxID=118510 RepID=A0A6L2NZZ8_TANCI|nr:hypothetical protein [Tanacetum cinerariifolium]
MRPFGCSVTILNTKYHLGKFDGKADKGFFVGYSLNSKTFRVLNSRTKIVEQNLHIRFSENTLNVVGTQSNSVASTKVSDNACQARKETKPVNYYILLQLWTANPPFSQDTKSSQDDGFKPSSDDGNKVDEDPIKGIDCNDQEKEMNVNNTNNVNTVSLTVNAASTNEDNELPFDPNMPALEDVGTFDFLNKDEDDDMDAKSAFLCGKIEEEVYAVYKELDDRLVRATTTASSLKAEQDSGNIDKTQSKATPNEASSLRTTSGGGPRCQEAMMDTIAQTRMKLNELMKLCTNLQSKVFELEKTKTTQALEITSLKRRVKKLKKKQRSRTHKLKRLYKVVLTTRVDSSKDEPSLCEDASKQGRKINDIDADEDITLVNDQDDTEMFDVNDLQGEELHINTAKLIVDAAHVSAAGEVNVASIATTVSATAKISTKEITLAQALVEIKTTKPKSKEIVLQEPRRTNTFARERTEKELEDNIAMIETWDNVQAKIDVDYQMAERMQAEEQQELTDKEKATLFIAFKRVSTFLDFRTELVEGSLKRAGKELTQESAKKQKVEDDKETSKLKQLMEIIPDEEEVAIDAIPLAIKSPRIVDWKIYKKGKKSYYQIIRGDRSLKMYMFFRQILKSFDREDLKDLYKLVKDEYRSTRPVEDLDLLILGDLKTMFEPHVQDAIMPPKKTTTPMSDAAIKALVARSVADALAEHEANISRNGYDNYDTDSGERRQGRIVAITTKDMQKRRNDVNARTTLLLALPDEHQLRFSKYETAKELWEAILKTFGGNEATKKTKKSQLKLQYGNFKADGSETLEQTFNRLQAIVSHLEFMDVEIEQDDLNQKFLTSLTPEWLMYTIVLRNIDDLDTMSLDDVYNHLKVYEPKVQKKSESNSQNMAFISSSNTSSGKGKVHTASVLTASTQVSTASTDVAAASLSHDTICAYIATQSNGSRIKYEDITQIDEDDIKEMDIKWNMALLSMRDDRFWKKTGKKITIQGSNVVGFDKSKVKCFNCHKMGDFARECRAPRSQDRGKRESYKQGPKEEEPAPKALMAIDGIRWDWSYMANEEETHALVADDEVPTEFALMSKSSSSSDNEVYDDSYCSKSCRKNTKNLNTKISKLNEELSDCDTNLYNYKRGLSQVEARLVEFKENEVKYCERIRVLERDAEIRDNKIEYLKNELEQIKKEKECLDNKLTGFENASKDLDNLLGSQRSDKNKEGLGYSAVPPPPAQIYSPRKKDLSWTGLPEFVDDTVTDYRRPTPSIDASKCNKSELQSSNFSVFKHGESTGSIMSKSMIKFVKEADCPRVIKINNTKNARNTTVKYAEMYRNILKDNGETWPKDDYTHKNMTPRAVLLKPGTTPIVVSRPNMNVAQPKMTSFAKTAPSNVKRSFQRKSTVKNQPRVPRVSTVTEKIPTVDSKFPTAKSTLTADLRDKGKVVKASTR